MWGEIRKGQAMFRLQTFSFHILRSLEIRVKEEGQTGAAHAAKG